MYISTDKRYRIFLYTGFCLLLVVFISLAVFHFNHIIQSNALLRETITNNDTQSRAAMGMRVAVRERAIILWNMTFQDDAFEKDNLYQQFSSFGSRFGRARLEYLSTSQTEKEQVLFNQLDKETSKRAPELRLFADLILDNAEGKIYFKKLDKALSEQVVVSGLLDQIINLQQIQNEQAHKKTAIVTSNTLSNLIAWALVFIISVILFARTIIKVANKQSSALTKANRELSLLARNDHLTKLPNRLFLSEHLTLTLSHAKRHDKEGVLIYIDLDGFKPINDKYGHNMGDNYLKAISAAIKKLLRESDVLARIGGDEFVVVLYTISSKKDAIVVANKLLKTLSSTYMLDNVSLSASASIGICYFPEKDMGVTSLLKSADAAMYGAKQTGKNRYYIHQTTS